MKKGGLSGFLCFVFFAVFFMLSGIALAAPGDITTIAGNGTAGFSGDGGPATSASLYYPTGVAVDSIGNIYIADTNNSRIRKVGTDGTITTIAGDGGWAEPRGLAVDSIGNIYIADYGSHRIRKVATDGVITTVAGNGTLGFSGDGGPATSAMLNYPRSVAVDSIGNIYIADRYNVRIRKVGTDGVITTVAGNGTAGYSGDGGPATSASLDYLTGVAVDSIGNIYIADDGSHRIRKVGTDGVITTFAGNGTLGFSGDGGPATSARLYYPMGVAVDSIGNIYIAEYGNSRIRKVATDGVITTVAGNGTLGGYSGDGGPATSASLASPMGVAVDSIGNIYIADTYNQRIRKVESYGDGTGPRNASGTGEWNPGTGTLTIHTTASNFVCDGLFVGTEIMTGVTITPDTMIWPDADGPTWTRTPAGAANDPVGVWTTSDSYTGSSWTLTINGVGEFTLAAVIVQCSSGGGEQNPAAWTNHWSNGIVPSGYYVPLGYKDPGQSATAVSVTGPGTGSPWSLTYDTNWGGWNSWILENTPFLGATYPTGLPYTYTFTITDGTGTWTAPSTVFCFQEEFATGLSPIGTVTTGTPTFSWTGVTGGQYSVNLYDGNGNHIWSNDTYQGATDIAYTGPPLTEGMTYNYRIVVNSSSACSNGQSFAQASFTYQTAPTPLYVAWTDDTYVNNEIFLKKSTDNGATWAFQRLTNNTGNSQFPVVAVSGNNVYVVWQDDTYATGVPEIFLKRSTDSGATWQFQRLTTNTGNSQAPAIAVNGNNVYVVWQDDTYGPSGVSEIFLKKSIDSGATWTFQRLTNNTGVSMNPSIRVNGNNVYVVWQDDTYGPTGVPEIFLKRSTDSGATWQFQRLTTNAGYSGRPSMVVDGSNIYVVWPDDTYGNYEIFFKRSIDGGNTWAFQRLTTNAGTSGRPSIALSSGNLYVVWEDNTYGNNEIFFKKSIDGGNTWAFQRLTNNTGVSMNPSIRVNGTDVYAVWQDDTYGNNEIFLKKSTDNGATWTFQRLTTNAGNSVTGSSVTEPE